METLVSIFAGLGVLLTVAEVLMGFPQLRTLWRALRAAPGAIGRKLDRAACERMPVVRPASPPSPEVLRRRERLGKVRRFAQWLMKADRAPPEPPRLSYRDRKALRAAGLEDVFRHLERRSRR